MAIFTNATKHRVGKLLPWLFYGLLIIFLVLYLRSIDWHKLHHLHIAWTYVVIASAIALFSRYWQVLIWLVLLVSLGATDLYRSKRQLTYVYAKSWLGRYIPGTAPWILGKIYFASKHGIAKEKLGVSSLLEGALQVVVLLVVSFALLLFDPRFGVISGQLRVFMAIAVVALLLVMLPPVFNRLISFAYRLLRRKRLASEHLASSSTILKGAGLYVVGAFLNGISFFFITKGIYPSLGYRDLLFVISASNLSGALGMLAIFVPSGIGVREGVQLVLLATIMPKEIALVVVVASRIWSVVIDLMFFGLGWSTRKDPTLLPATAKNL